VQMTLSASPSRCGSRAARSPPQPSHHAVMQRATTGPDSTSAAAAAGTPALQNMHLYDVDDESMPAAHAAPSVQRPSMTNARKPELKRQQSVLFTARQLHRDEESIDDSEFDETLNTRSVLGQDSPPPHPDEEHHAADASLLAAASWPSDSALTAPAMPDSPSQHKRHRRLKQRGGGRSSGATPLSPTSMRRAQDRAADDLFDDVLARRRTMSSFSDAALVQRAMRRPDVLGADLRLAGLTLPPSPRPRRQKSGKTVAGGHASMQQRGQSAKHLLPATANTHSRGLAPLSPPQRNRSQQLSPLQVTAPSTAGSSLSGASGVALSSGSASVIAAPPPVNLTPPSMDAAAAPATAATTAAAAAPTGSPTSSAEAPSVRFHREGSE